MEVVTFKLDSAHIDALEEYRKDTIKNLIGNGNESVAEIMAEFSIDQVAKLYLTGKLEEGERKNE